MNSNGLGTTSASSTMEPSTILQAINNYSGPLFYLLFPAIFLPVILMRVVYTLLSLVNSNNQTPFQKKGQGQFGTSSSTDIEYWLCRCSICFDKNQELCLNKCRDQFCRDCFDRYVKEVVNNSWGLNITKIKCPVCADVLPISEWSRYVDGKTLNQYKLYNQPYRSMSRCCGECGDEVYAAKVELHLSDKEKVSYMNRIEMDCWSLLLNENISHEAINLFLCNLKYNYSYFLDGKISGGIEIYRNTMDQLLKLKSNKSNLDEFKPDQFMMKASDISSKLVAIELKPEVWKELQFEHIARFPQAYCQKCQGIVCLLCGSNDHHLGLSCLDYMRKKLQVGADSEEHLKNLSWTLNNSKNCPHCRILINRDDGCNKVDCLYCGYRFCWICLSPWSEKCGFYQCQSLPTISNNLNTSDNSSFSDKPELGIPDVATIEAKFHWN